MTTPVVGNTSNANATSGLIVSDVHTVAPGSNLLVICAAFHCSAAPTLSATWTPDSTGTPVAMIALETAVSAGSNRRMRGFYLINPATGSGTITVTANQTITVALCIAFDLAGVNTDTGLTFDLVSSDTGTAISNTVPPLSNTTLDTDFVFAFSHIATANNQAPANSQTEIADITGTGNGFAVGYLPATARTTTIGWTFSSSGYAIQAVAIRPAGVAVIVASEDNYMQSNAATTNFTTDPRIFIGEAGGAVSITRSWVKPDFTGIPALSLISAGAINFIPDYDDSSNARTLFAHRCLRATVNNEQTWNVFSAGNNWGTAGASNSSTDYDGAVTLGSMAQAAAPTLGTLLPMTLLASEIQKMFDGTYTNNGIILFVDTQSNDQIGYGSEDNVSPSKRIRFVYQYAPPPSKGGVLPFFMYANQN